MTQAPTSGPSTPGRVRCAGSRTVRIGGDRRRLPWRATRSTSPLVEPPRPCGAATDACCGIGTDGSSNPNGTDVIVRNGRVYAIGTPVHEVPGLVARRHPLPGDGGEARDDPGHAGAGRRHRELRVRQPGQPREPDRRRRPRFDGGAVSGRSRRRSSPARPSLASSARRTRRTARRRGPGRSWACGCPMAARSSVCRSAPSPRRISATGLVEAAASRGGEPHGRLRLRTERARRRRLTGCRRDDAVRVVA